MSAPPADPQGTDYTTTAYTGLGQVHSVSNPYRSTSDSTYGLTTTTYDGLGRTVQVSYADGSSATTAYTGNSSTVTDPAGNQRSLVYDGLGRLTSVSENPTGLNYSTAYTYNALNDLLNVNQSGQTRTFSYDSLKRVLSATNPESGTTSYTYDNDGNVLTRQDARGITTTYAYDALNRPQSKSYSDGVTPTANFYYDEGSATIGNCTNSNLSYPTGRLTHTTTANSQGTLLTATLQDYDPMGRVTGYWQATPLNCGSSLWSAFYSYDLAGDLTSWIHPAGFLINQPTNGAREVSQVTSSLNDATHPANLATITYTPFGSVSTLQNGCVGSGCTPLLETYAYNNRLQAAMIELGTSGNPTADSCRVYNFYASVANPTSCVTPTQGTTDNGNVAGYYYNDNVNTGLSHPAAYTYDGVNRLASAGATGNSTYSQTFSYDAYGNMSCTPTGSGCVAFTYNGANNRISGYTYDAAGDVTNDGTYTYQWDAEAHLTKVINGAGTAISINTYNALGQRVREVTQTETTDEAYGAGGNLLWRYTGDSNSRAFVPFNGGILAEYWSGGTVFDHPDELGSMSTSSDYTGNTLNERLFYPFGESWTGAALPNLGTHQTFAQLPDYDPETDQYNTANRHYSPSGRWMSPDPGGLKVVRLDDPQTWNMYAYARNNPTTLTDPSGLEPDPPVGQKATCISAECTKQQSIEGQEGGQVPAQNTANENTPVGNTTEGELAKTMTHEDGSLSTPKKGDPDVLSDAKEALANAIINNAELKKPEQVATPDRSASAQDAQIMKDAVTNRAKGGADPVEGRHYYGTTHNPRVQSRPAGNHLKGAAGRETVYEKFGPFRDSTSRRPTWIVIYNNPGQ